MTAAEDLLAIVETVSQVTPAMRRDPLVATQATVDQARELGDEDDGETLDWLLRSRALIVVSPSEMAAKFAPVRYTNRAARRAARKRRK